jgi:hypothetical protein
MADIANALQAFLDFFTNKDGTAAQAAKSPGGVAGYADSTGITECDFDELVTAARPYLTSNQVAALDAATVTSQGANVNVGGQSASGYNAVPIQLPPTATNAQRLAGATYINNTTNNVTTYDNDLNNTLNQVALGGDNVAVLDQQTASAPGAVSVGGDVRDSALATGAGAVAGSGAADVIGTTGGEVGGDLTNIQDAGLAGVNFGDGPTGAVTGAAPGGVAAGPGGAASGTGPAAGGGSQQAGENIAGAAGGGSVDASLGGNVQAGDNPLNLGPGQVAGGDIDQSADDIVVAEDSVVAQDQSAAAGTDEGDVDIA